MEAYPLRPDDPAPLQGMQEWLNRMGTLNLRLVAWYPMSLGPGAGATVVCVFIQE